MPPCSREELVFAEKKGLHNGKISVADVASSVLKGFLELPPACKLFFETKRVFFGGGRVHFFFLVCVCVCVCARALVGGGRVWHGLFVCVWSLS